MPENNGKNPENETKDIASQCLDAQGYLLFAAILSPIRDKNGHGKINFQYRRYHLSLEDAKQAVMALKEFVDKEIEHLIKQYEEGGDENAEKVV